MQKTLGIAIAFALVLSASACGSGRNAGDRAGAPAGTAESDLSGRVEADGSSTVGPFTTAAAEAFGREHSGVRVTVGISGTGGGFERFCRGETDLSNASRPIKDEETDLCEQNGVDFVEFHVVNDGLAVVVNPGNDWVDCFTIEQLNAIWAPGSEIDNWSDVPGGDYPDLPLTLAGPGTDSGTFDYFTETVNDEGGASRSDYQASEDDNVIVQAVSGAEGGLGYFGLSYVQENDGTIKAVPIENQDGECVEPSIETVQDGSYNPLGRPLFIYAKTASFERPEVQAFIQYLLDHNHQLAETALYVPLTEGQLGEAQSSLDEALAGAGS
ncbi:MAG: PstS family phosphate ABC transporter substrate-binding protein [Thermoleophilia bacterium]|nr:PstS family phosphate ABC transporter substrate-binding protein [Thermoleophilia bacterium]